MRASTKFLWSQCFHDRSRFLLAANEATHNLALAVRDKMPNDSEHASALSTHLQAAQAASLQMRVALAEAEHGAFAGWYASDSKFAVNTRINEIVSLLQTK